MTDVVDLPAAVADHASLFNDAVRCGDYATFLATFADDAVLRFADIPIGPFKGRAAIAAAYAAQPTVRWRDGQVADLTIAFD